MRRPRGVRPAMAGLLAVVVVLGLTATGSARADTPDSATLSRATGRIGERATLTLTVHTAANATVQVEPGGPSWNGVEVVSITGSTTRPDGDGLVHIITLVVAPFSSGAVPFIPLVSVTRDSVAVPRELPPVGLSVAATLAENQPLELSPLPRPREVAGAESPLLRPAIAGGAVVGVALAGLVLFLLVRRIAAAVRKPAAAVEEGRAVADLGSAEGLIHTDPIAAYRGLAASVRAVLAERYALPAYALTARELQRRLESNGVDRFQTRLVGGFLEECDAVVYAGYLPASERRQADLVMAREIVEGAG